MVSSLRVDLHDQRPRVVAEVLHARAEEARLPSLRQQQLRPLASPHVEARSIAEVHQRRIRVSLGDCPNECVAAECVHAD